MPNEFFDAIGTVRMEAFVHDKENQKENQKDDRKKTKESRNQRPLYGKKKELSSWGLPEDSIRRGERRSEDPFRGF